MNRLSFGVLPNSDLKAYEALNCSDESGLLYGSTKYLALIAELLPNATQHHLAAFADGDLVGCLPTVSLNGPFGWVVNSLPYYGSNGGIRTSVGSDFESVGKFLLEQLDIYARSIRAVATLVISNPLRSSDIGFYDSNASSTVTDDRIGQITDLPTASDDIKGTLLALFHQKTRNAIRKAQRLDFAVAIDNTASAFEALERLHVENMAALGGLAKSRRFFEKTRRIFEAGADYDLFVARRNGRIVSGLLLFYYNRTAEYFVPATDPAFRSEQPLSLIILEAMAASVKRGLSYWNWGGTWPSQVGVYHFKSRWGTDDRPYRYYVREYPEHGSLRTRSKEELLAGYPGFFTVPFGALK